jgi:hypothetical protein
MDVVTPFKSDHVIITKMRLVDRLLKARTEGLESLKIVNDSPSPATDGLVR